MEWIELFLYYILSKNNVVRIKMELIIVLDTVEAINGPINKLVKAKDSILMPHGTV